MMFSKILAVATIVFSMSASATGIPPIDFGRLFHPYAERELKSSGIDDVRRIVSAWSPFEATFCREGSSSLWEMVFFTEAQVREITSKNLSVEAMQMLRRQTASSRLAVEIPDPSEQCKLTFAESVETYIGPGTAKHLTRILIVLLLVQGLVFAYRAVRLNYYSRRPFTDPRLQEAAASLPREFPLLKAIVAFALAGAIAYFSHGL
jgi:hypothetical protein